MGGRMAAAGLMITLGLLAPPTAEAQQASPAQPVTTAVTERGELQETVHLDGVIEAVQQSTVSAQTSGTVQRLPFDVDDSVAAGDLIVQLEDSEQRSRLRQAEAGLEEAEAALADAGQRFERIEAVHERGLVSRQEFDQARNNLAAARARSNAPGLRFPRRRSNSPIPVCWRRTVAFLPNDMSKSEKRSTPPASRCSAACPWSSSGLWWIFPPRSMPNWPAWSVRPRSPC